MKQTDSLQYVKNLEMMDLNESFPVSKSVKPALDESIQEATEQSYLNAKSIVSFVSGISPQNRQDVLNSVLLAQLAANKQFPNENQSLEWYTAFVEILNRTGWVIDQAEFSRFESSDHVFEIENVIIDILVTAFGGTFINVITKTLSAIKSLSDGDGRIKVFEKNTHSLSKGAFQIGVAIEEQGVVSLQIGTFLLTSTGEIKRILFFKTTKDKTSLDYCSRNGTFNESLYSQIRSAVEAKLGKKVTEYIAEIEI
jgi:hypothetical protein